jgi:hypothetical protein
MLHLFVASIAIGVFTAVSALHRLAGQLCCAASARRHHAVHITRQMPQPQRIQRVDYNQKKCLKHTTRNHVWLGYRITVENGAHREIFASNLAETL